MTKQEILDLITEGEIAQAIKALRQAMPNDNTILNLAGQWNRLQKDIINGIISPDFARLSQNQIVNNLILAAEKMPNQTGTGSTATGGSSSGGAKTVFISYNHKDMAVAGQIKSFLEGRGIKVTIDSEAMKPGEDIKTFINNCIRNADVTLSLVSTNSLLSAWVGMETINTLVGESIADKKFIACVVQSDFYDMSFVRTSIVAIDERLAKLKEEIMFRVDNNLGIEDLQNERTRNQSLKNDLPKIVANLKDRLNVDINGDNFKPGMERIVKAILS
ncbi:MAG: toll/interleukin-1 receptor domain-containing protein [Bacteroidetes bacterium]|nr:toll/interleukin-1 receptor domain-containing protein [Bacteroidota bacterium]